MQAGKQYKCDGLHVMFMMLTRRGRLEIGDILKVVAPW
jgi:hypothetical protein